MLLEATPLTTLFENTTTVITNIMTLFGSVASTLMGNVLFQIMFGIIVLGIVISLVFYMVRKVKHRG